MQINADRVRGGGGEFVFNLKSSTTQNSRPWKATGCLAQLHVPPSLRPLASSQGGGSDFEKRAAPPATTIRNGDERRPQNQSNPYLTAADCPVLILVSSARDR